MATPPADLTGRVTNTESRLTLAESRLHTIEQKLAAATTPPVTPPANTPSPDNTVVTNTTDGIRYASGTVFKITAARKISRTPPGATAPIIDAVTANVVSIAKLNATTLVQKNTSENYYTRQDTGQDGGWTQITPSAAGPLAPPAPPPGTYFKVQNGGIYKPDGSPFKPTGIDIWWTCISNKDRGWNQANQVIADWNTGAPLLQAFPDMNAIRMAFFRDGGGLGGFPSPAELKPWVDFCTAKRIVLIIDAHDYSGGSNYVYNWSDGSLQAAVDFFKTHATAWKNYPYVWFQTENEPGTPNDDEMNALYDAVRGTGNETIVALSWVTWGDLDRVTPTIANRMHNVIIDDHYYAIGTGSNNMNLQDHINQIRNLNAAMNAKFKSADGEIPICCLEFGDACCGSVEPAGLIACEAVVKSVYKGWTAWNWTTDANRSWGHDILNNGATAINGGAVVKPYMVKG